jgi:hypothetical protein
VKEKGEGCSDRERTEKEWLGQRTKRKKHSPPLYKRGGVWLFSKDLRSFLSIILPPCLTALLPIDLALERVGTKGEGRSGKNEE